jgi:ATP-dependent Lon protease
VLDPGQNKNFIDRYLDMTFDLSGVIFILTADNTDTIQSPLRDLLEIVQF